MPQDLERQIQHLLSRFRFLWWLIWGMLLFVVNMILVWRSPSLALLRTAIIPLTMTAMTSVTRSSAFSLQRPTRRTRADTNSVLTQHDFISTSLTAINEEKRLWKGCWSSLLGETQLAFKNANLGVNSDFSRTFNTLAIILAFGAPHEKARVKRWLVQLDLLLGGIRTVDLVVHVDRVERQFKRWSQCIQSTISLLT